MVLFRRIPHFHGDVTSISIDTFCHNGGIQMACPHWKCFLLLNENEIKNANNKDFQLCAQLFCTDLCASYIYVNMLLWILKKNNQSQSETRTKKKRQLTAAVHWRIAQWIFNFECTRITTLAKCDIIAANHIIRCNNWKILCRLVWHVRHVLCECYILFRINKCRHYLVILECDLFKLIELAYIYVQFFGIIIVGEGYQFFLCTCIEWFWSQWFRYGKCFWVFC